MIQGRPSRLQSAMEASRDEVDETTGYRLFCGVPLHWQCAGGPDHRKVGTSCRRHNRQLQSSRPHNLASLLRAVKQGSAHMAFVAWLKAPNGPRTTHFWGPVLNWGLVLSGLVDL